MGSEEVVPAAGERAGCPVPGVHRTAAGHTAVGWEEQGEGRSGTPTEGESRARPSFRLESHRGALVGTSLQLRHCPGARSERRRCVWTGSLLWSCSGFAQMWVLVLFPLPVLWVSVQPPRRWEVSTRVTLRGCSPTDRIRWDGVSARTGRVSLCSPRSALKGRSSPAVGNSSAARGYFA